ncbi:hypothetical protein FRC09_018667, partial [Ceratobasidium sp. 395]
MKANAAAAEAREARRSHQHSALERKAMAYLGVTSTHRRVVRDTNTTTNLNSLTTSPYVVRCLLRDDAGGKADSAEGGLVDR